MKKLACLRFTLLFTSWSTCSDNGVNMNFASDKSRFCEIHANTLQVENMALEVLSEVFSMILVFLSIVACYHTQISPISLFGIVIK